MAARAHLGFSSRWRWRRGGHGWARRAANGAAPGVEVNHRATGAHRTGTALRRGVAPRTESRMMAQKGWAPAVGRGGGPARRAASLQRAGQLGQAGRQCGGCCRGSVRAGDDGFFLCVLDNARELGQPLSCLGRELLLQGGGSRRDRLLGFLGRCRAAGAVRADMEVLEEGAVSAEAQQAVLTPAGLAGSISARSSSHPQPQEQHSPCRTAHEPLLGATCNGGGRREVRRR